MSACSKAGCHAVLASLSERYPPLEGRSPTCYSPVCHSTHPFRDFRVRLACVRHAASVDSEPGSNSHVKGVVPAFLADRLSSARSIPREATGLTRGRFLALRCSIRLLFHGHRQPPDIRTDDPGRPILRCHALTLIVLDYGSALSAAAQAAPCSAA